VRKFLVFLVAVFMSLTFVACVGDRNGNGIADEEEDFKVYCQTHMSECTGGGGGCIDCTDNDNPNP